MTPEIKASTLVKADGERVFAAVATSEGWDHWFTNGTSIDTTVGGAVHFVWTEVGPDKDEVEDRGEVRAYEPGRRFQFTWGAPESLVTIELFPHDEGTLVELVESGIPDDEEGWTRFVSCAVGWGEALTLMKFWVEHGVTYR